MHMHFPGLSRLVKRPDGVFAAVPEAWSGAM
jgi:hypothetical protein